MSPFHVGPGSRQRGQARGEEARPPLVRIPSPSPGQVADHGSPHSGSATPANFKKIVRGSR
ncbi:hypothetical protein N658DRAFT_491337 [Parathielavia hyrcaniae]|uniref:Uncharacterized protein n=1 Tax=Parathielavia hyrcaniae TaxID=113614 RepID=A0AAN6QAK9_9PEZI|nr:hypothetical protein N658DRAFT_491337 [Parathielavia hyrcaniae]